MGNSKVWLIAGEQIIIATTGDVQTFDPALRQHPRLKVISLDLLNDAAVKAAADQMGSDYGRIYTNAGKLRNRINNTPAVKRQVNS